MNNLFDLTGKVALVTGASSRLGVQFAKGMIKRGYGKIIKVGLFLPFILIAKLDLQQVSLFLLLICCTECGII